MLGLISTGATLLFPAGRALKLVKNGVGITNSTNPLVLTKNTTLTILDCCAPPPVRLVAHCVAVVALIGASVISPNPVTIGSSIHIVTELYELC
jgi:hypothetical protein